MHSPDEILAALLAKETRTHGSVRPPWVAFPSVHPFDIAWRMGACETHLMLWRMWAEGRRASETEAVIARYGAVPADWLWWATDALDGTDGPDDIYDIPFEDVCARRCQRRHRHRGLAE